MFEYQAVVWSGSQAYAATSARGREMTVSHCTSTATGQPSLPIRALSLRYRGRADGGIEGVVPGRYGQGTTPA